MSQSKRDEAIRAFEMTCRGFKHKLCRGCRIVSMNVDMRQSGYCSSCCRRGDVDHFLNQKLLPIWYEDGAPQFHVPLVLKRLSHAEKMLIQRVSPFVALHHIKHGLFGLSGHVCAFEQEIKAMANILPRLSKDVSVIRVLQELQSEIGNSSTSQTRAFRVNRKNVLEALAFLKKCNREYSDIVIDATRLNWIDGEESDLNCHVLMSSSIPTNKDDDITNADMGPCEAQAVQPRMDATDVQAFGYVDEGGLSDLSAADRRINSELQQTLRAADNREEYTMDWPATSETPVSEYDNVRIFARAFPWLFPGGFGDIRDYNNPEQNITEWGRRLLYYEDARFATDKIFCFFAMNYIIRHRNSSSGRFFIDKFQKNVPDTLDELKESIREGTSTFVNSLTYWNKRIKGSSPHWFHKRKELYTWINQHIELDNGPPTMFITLSCAEYFWPDVIDLLRDRLQIAGEDCSQCEVGSPRLIQLVNDYTLVIQEYFQKRTEAWLETVGRAIFNIKHYWVRYEFAPGRGQIHAHLLAIPADHDIFTCCHKLSQEGNDRAQTLSNWAFESFGLTASVDNDFEELNAGEFDNPVTLRFTDLSDDEETKRQDLQRLMKGCEMHTCSKFCLRNGTEKK